MLQSEVYYFFVTVIVNYHYQSPFSRKKREYQNSNAIGDRCFFIRALFPSKSRIALHYYRNNVTDILTGKKFFSLFLALVLLHCLNEEAG